MFRTAAPSFALFVVTGCALYSDVTIGPLHVRPAKIERGSDLQSMIRKADYLRAIEMAPVIEARSRKTAAELAALGSAFLAAGRYDEARTYLRAALDLDPLRTTYADIAWSLSQLEYMSNNLESSLEWALVAGRRGLQVKQWHLDYLRSLAAVDVYRFQGTAEARVPFRFGRPDVPRLAVTVNGGIGADAVIDSGAVLSIASERLTAAGAIRRAGEFTGTFYGLLGEPIAVRFGIIDSLTLGDMTIINVPVAIMPDEKMRFLVSKSDGTEIHMDLLLGSHLLKEFRIALDFDANVATFTALSAAQRQPVADQNLFFHDFRPHVRGTINGRGWFLFVLDTGSEITFLNESHLSHLGSLPVQLFGSGGHTATLQGLGGAMKRGTKVENVEIGIDRWGGTFKTLPMYSSGQNENAAGIIGQNFVRHFNVVIDFGKMRLDLERR